MASARAGGSERKLPYHESWRVPTSQLAFPFGPREVSMVIGKLDRMQRAPDPSRANIGSSIRLMDLEHGETAEFVLVRPRDSAPTDGRLSIYSPLGAHLLGASPGQTVAVPLLGRRIKFHVLEVASETAERAPTAE